MTCYVFYYKRDKRKSYESGADIKIKKYKSLKSYHRNFKFFRDMVFILPDEGIIQLYKEIDNIIKNKKRLKEKIEKKKGEISKYTLWKKR
jgi:hypothetical protein